MARDSADRFVILHALRVRSLSSVDELADATGLAPSVVGAVMTEFAGAALATRREGVRPGWVLTPAGRAHHADAARHDLGSGDTAALVAAAYRRFLELNPEVLAACAAWQLHDDGSNGLNDHSDPDYDGRVIERLLNLHQRSVPVVGTLAAAMTRFERFSLRLGRAAGHLANGETDWFTRPTIDSYHTVWFELHEDLLRTLGIERGSEPAT